MIAPERKSLVAAASSVFILAIAAARGQTAKSDKLPSSSERVRLLP